MIIVGIDLASSRSDWSCEAIVEYDAQGIKHFRAIYHWRSEIELTDFQRESPPNQALENAGTEAGIHTHSNRSGPEKTTA